MRQASKCSPLRSNQGPARRFENSRITATPANMLLHPRKQFVVGRIGLFIQQSNDTHDHAGSAIAALKSALFQESPLNRMQCVAFREALDSENFLHLCIPDGCDAGGDALAIE